MFYLYLTWIFCFFSDSNEDESITVGEGILKLIPCVCSDSAIHWYKIGTELDPQQIPDKGVNTLKFTSVTLDDDGIYVCKKEDKNRTIIKTVEVHVTPSEIWLLTCYQTFVQFILMEVRVT